MYLRRLLGAGAVISSFALFLPIENAVAHVWRTGDIGCGFLNSADSATHTYWYNAGLSNEMQWATNWARQFSLDPTDLTTMNVGSLAFDTDVVVYDQDYTTWCGFTWHPAAGGLIGLVQCVSLATNPANACEKSEVRYDESWTATASPWEENTLACHENGHTLGLSHVGPTAWSCMVENNDPNKNSFSAADVGWINAHY